MLKNAWKYRLFQYFQSHLIPCCDSWFRGILQRPTGSKLASRSIFGGRCEYKKMSLCICSLYGMIGNPVHSRVGPLVSHDTNLSLFNISFQTEFFNQNYWEFQRFFQTLWLYVMQTCRSRSIFYWIRRARLSMQTARVVHADRRNCAWSPLPLCMDFWPFIMGSAS